MVKNWLVILGLCLAVASLIIAPEFHPVAINFFGGFLGFFLGFSVLIIFYIFNLMAAGDVKFAAVLGVWVGWEMLLPIWALSCAFSVVHGVVVKYGGYFFPTLISGNGEIQKRNKKFIPYVSYLSLATVIVMGFYKNQ